MIIGVRQMKVQEAVSVARFLGVPEEEVLRRAGAEDPPRLPPGRPGRPRGQGSARISTPRPDSIPIRSATPNNGKWMVLDSEPAGTTPRPANLTAVRGAYAVYMFGMEMEPRYVQGWLLHVNPFKPPTRGRDVVVRKIDGTVLIKQFVAWEGNTLVVRQLSPEETIRIPREEIAECHLVVGVDQEG